MSYELIVIRKPQLAVGTRRRAIVGKRPEQYVILKERKRLKNLPIMGKIVSYGLPSVALRPE